MGMLPDTEVRGFGSDKLGVIEAAMRVTGEGAVADPAGFVLEQAGLRVPVVEGPNTGLADFDLGMTAEEAALAELRDQRGDLIPVDVPYWELPGAMAHEDGPEAGFTD